MDHPNGLGVIRCNDAEHALDPEHLEHDAFHRRDLELEFYRTYFNHAEWLRETSNVVDEAVDISTYSAESAAVVYLTT